MAAKKQKIHYIVIQSLDDGETIICTPSNLKSVKRMYFAKGTGRDIETFVFYNVFESHVWLSTPRPKIESYCEERDE